MEFSNPTAAKAEFVKIRRGQMHVPGTHPFEVTKRHIFEGPVKATNEARKQYLMQQDRGFRNFNIISGAFHTVGADSS